MLLASLYWIYGLSWVRSGPRVLRGGGRPLHLREYCMALETTTQPNQAVANHRHHVKGVQLADCTPAAVVTPLLASSSSTSGHPRNPQLDRTPPRLGQCHPVLSHPPGHRHSFLLALPRRLGSQACHPRQDHQVLYPEHPRPGPGYRRPHHRIRERSRP